MIDEVVVIDLYHKYIGYLYPSETVQREIVSRLPINDVIIMQSTGLKDKNGVEIFEGDIVRYKDLETFNDFPINEILKIKYSDDFLEWVTVDKNGILDDLYNFTDTRELAIIGNIYENPELLEVEE